MEERDLSKLKKHFMKYGAMRYFLCFLCFLIMTGFLSGCGADGKPEEMTAAIYTNPIDAYFLPLLETGSEAGRRAVQDTYRGVWQAEFDNVMLWMKNKCIYQEDIDQLDLYVESVEALIETTHTIMVTDWLNDYNLPPGSTDRNFWGNGTRSGLNQVTAEIYRDACIMLIDDSYVYLEKDYSQEVYY